MAAAKSRAKKAPAKPKVEETPVSTVESTDEAPVRSKRTDTFRLLFTGRIGNQDQIRRVEKNGRTQLYFSIAVNRLTGSRGQREIKPEWYRVALYGQRADDLLKFPSLPGVLVHIDSNQMPMVSQGRVKSLDRGVEYESFEPLIVAEDVKVLNVPRGFQATNADVAADEASDI